MYKCLSIFFHTGLYVITMFGLLLLVTLPTASGRSDSHLDSLVAALTETNKDTSRADLLLEIGWEYQTINLDSAISFMERSKELSEELNDKRGIYNCSYNLATFYSDSGLHERSIELTKQSLAIVEEGENLDDMVQCLMTIAQEYVLMQDYSKAVVFNKRALEVEGSRENLNGMLFILYRRAQIYEQMTDFSKALEIYERALSIYKRLGNDLKVSRTLGNIGVIHEYNGDYDVAIRHYLKALGIAEKELEKADESGKEDEINSARHTIVSHLAGLGAVYSYMGDYDKALEYMQWSYRLNNKYKNKMGIAGSLNNMGMILMNQGKYIEALESYMKSLTINQELNDKREIAGIYNNIAVVYYERGDNMDMVKEYLEKALLIKREIGHTMGIILGLNNLGELYMKLGEYDEAIAYSKQSLDMAMDIQSMDDIMFACEILSTTSEKMGNYKEAYAYYRQYSNSKDSLFNEDKSKEIGKLEAKFEMDKKLEEARRLTEEHDQIQKTEKMRRDNLQYSGILIFLVLVFTSVFFLGKLSIPIRLAEGMIFFAFLLFFEFTLVMLDPYIEQYSSGAPAIKLGFNAVLAGMIFPLHSFFESKLKKNLAKHL